MTTPRSLANQKLYHARILAESWRREMAEEVVPAGVLAGAFEPACRLHLRRAYGWFLLEIIEVAEMPELPPENCEHLPAIAAGKALPGEVRELQQLERQGWLAELLSDREPPMSAVRPATSLAQPIRDIVGPDDIDRWIELLTNIFDRMADSLDEY